MWTQRDQFSNKQLTFIDDHLNIRLYKQRLSNQPHMQQGVFKVHLAANSLRSNSLVPIPVMHFVIPCQSSSKFRPWCNLCFSLSAISASYTTTLCLTYRNITGRASIAYHCATLSFLHYYGGNSHISGTSSSWLTKILAYQTSSCASCRLYNTWTITFPCTIKFKEGLETTDKWPKS